MMPLRIDRCLARGLDCFSAALWTGALRPPADHRRAGRAGRGRAAGARGGPDARGGLTAAAASDAAGAAPVLASVDLRPGVEFKPRSRPPAALE
jgi:hypothetical protein